MKEMKKKLEEDKDDPWIKLADDINKNWKTVKDSASQRETWRKVEDGALTGGLRACCNLKGKLGYLLSIDSVQAMRTSCVYNELRMLLLTVNEAYMEVKGDIFEDEVSSARYYTKTCVKILELWSHCCRLTTELIILLRKFWETTDEHGELSKSVADTCSMAVKLLSTTVDLTKRPVADKQKEALVEKATNEATKCSDVLSNVLIDIHDLKSSRVGPVEAILEITTWMLYGLHHMSECVIAPCITEGCQEQEWMKAYTASLNNIITSLTTTSKENGDSTKQETDTDNTEKPAEEESKQDSVPGCVEVMNAFTEEYKRFTDEMRSTGVVTISLDDVTDPETRIIYRPEVYKELARCVLQRCDMKDRVTWLNEIGFTDEEKLVSDIHIITNGPLKVSQELEVSFKATVTSETDSKKIVVKAKTSGSWEKVDVLKQEVLSTTIHLSFKTSHLEAFVAYVEDPKEAQEISPEGSTITSPEHSQVLVQFPSGAVKEPTKINIKFLSYDKVGLTSYLEQTPDAVVAMIAVSQVVEMSSDSPATLDKYLSVQLTLDGDDTADTELVVVRYSGNQVQVLDKNQCRIRQTEYGVYRVDNKGLWSIGLARIKKVFVNLKETVKKEFMLMFGKVQICNIVTLVDDALRVRDKGLITFWIELLEKNSIKEQLDERSKAGLVEVQGSRSRDIAMKQAETLNVVVDGQIKLLGNSTDKIALTYLIGTDNHFVVPLECKRDQEKLPYVTFTCKEDGSSYTLHTVAIPVRDLTETPTEEMMSKHLTKQDENNSLREAIRAKEEAARNILSHNSLMCLARAMTAGEGQRLSTNLCVSTERVTKIQELCDGDAVTINFRILCEWRGNGMRSSMVDFLVNALRTIGRADYADVITNVRNLSRGLVQKDFC